MRVYSPTVAQPAFKPAGELVSLPAFAIPGREEYRFPLGLSLAVRRDLAAFGPNLVHVSSPDISGHRAVSWARNRQLPVLASVHTRFDSYLRYYHLAWLEPVAVALGKRRWNSGRDFGNARSARSRTSIAALYPLHTHTLCQGCAGVRRAIGHTLM